MKPFKPIHELIELLKGRGLTIPNERMAAKILVYENYYVVINGYKTMFLETTNPDDHYKANATFHELVALFSFDRKLRELLLPELLRVEHILKSKISYVFSEKHGHKHTDYLRVDSFNSSNLENFKRTNNLIYNLLYLIDKQKDKHNAIYHYYNTYGFVPLWVLTRVMTFGKIISFYGCMLLDEKIAVSKAFKLDPAKFKTLIYYIADFRNKCAHDERIYCHSKDSYKARRQNTIPSLPEHSLLNIQTNSKGLKHGKDDILALLIALRYFMQNDRYDRLLDRIDYALHYKLAKRLNSIEISDIEEIMGLTGNWLSLKHKQAKTNT